MRWRGKPVKDVLALIAFGGTIWMLGFGPATESCTYSLMGPLLAWACLDPSRKSESRLERFLLLFSVALFATALLSVALGYSRVIEAFGLQPIGAAALLARMLISGRPISTGHETPAVTRSQLVYRLSTRAA